MQCSPHLEYPEAFRLIIFYNVIRFLYLVQEISIKYRLDPSNVDVNRVRKPGSRENKVPYLFYLF